MTYDSNNIFAKILRGEAPAHIVHEDDMCFCMMDVMPQSTGHTLIIPREPAKDIFSVSDEGLQHLMLQTRRIAWAVDTVFQPEGVMIMQLNRSGAGQSVFHLHFHVIPRWGGLQQRFHARDLADSEMLADHAKRLREALIDEP